MKNLKLYPVLILFTALVLSVLTSCSSDSEFDGSGEGKGGSMARFTFLKGYLYVVDQSTLKTFDISNPENPNLLGTENVGDGVETIFPYENYLFLGTQWGMKIYSVEDDPIPNFLSDFEHSFSCDPVVVSNSIAYVTLRSGTTCQTGENRMEVVDVSDLRNPRLLNTIPMENPHGLSVSDTVLFVCEGDFGFKVFNIKDRSNPELISHYDSIPSYDVITNYGRKELIITGRNGIFQYDYQDPYQLKELSQILSTQGNE
ncbi:LVIVD repeat-containing protein [Marivirga sericea]|uniref:LVIVD repeat-containing protein n=1 Tax=Marivirga sericea TaxID=1028 RepID=A0A1X7KH34_9BACT|nr:hypothetical protein [Marivirga sericea]SMG40632.1 LVIVD repeat-containing protein [Marivirga sericea]